MLKIQSTSFIILLVLVTISCSHYAKNKPPKNSINKTDKYEPGDCFKFKEKIKDFGVIFLEEQNYPDGKEYNLFPVMLDTTKSGIEQFTYGKVYITGFPDFTKPNGRTEGFMVYHFLYQKDFKEINKFLKNVGAISIKSGYKNITGGTIAANFDEFRYQLKHWDKMFGDNGSLALVEEIMP